MLYFAIVNMVTNNKSKRKCLQNYFSLQLFAYILLPIMKEKEHASTFKFFVVLMNLCFNDANETNRKINAIWIELAVE